MTYGEYRIAHRDDYEMVGGEMVRSDTIDRKPHRMGEKEALEYYTAKLNDVWIELEISHVRKMAWKDFWHAASHLVEHLPVGLQHRLRELFAYGYCLGYEHGKNTLDRH